MQDPDRAATDGGSGSSRATPVIVAHGSNGQIEISGGWLTITRKGVMAALRRKFKADLPLAMGDISSVELDAPGPSTLGLIRFTFGAGRKRRRRGPFGRRFDENSVMFGRREAKEFEGIRDHVETYVDTRI